MSIGNLINTTADIERATTTASNTGGQSKTWAAAYADVPFVKQVASGKTVEQYGKLQLEVTHVFYTETAVSVQAGDRINEDGVYYLVQWAGDMAGRGVAGKIVARKIDQ